MTSHLKIPHHSKPDRDVEFMKRNAAYFWARCSATRVQAGLPPLTPERLPLDLGHRRNYVARHRVDQFGDTVVLPRIGTIGVVAAADPRFEPVPCTWCQLDGHVTTVRVQADPDPANPDARDEFPDSCLCCAPKVIAQARAEQAERNDADIHVEFAEQAPKASDGKLSCAMCRSSRSLPDGRTCPQCRGEGEL
jgi:hypothetical protein